MKKSILIIFILLGVLITGCVEEPGETDIKEEVHCIPGAEEVDGECVLIEENRFDTTIDYCGDEIGCVNFVETYIANMTIYEKAGQMIQAERQHIKSYEVSRYNIGSVLNGGGSVPGDEIEDWINMYDEYRLQSLSSSSGIPIIFGTDSVHGNNNLLNATLFPHNIGLGAANDTLLMEKIGEVTALETMISGISWTFSPAVSVAQNITWGRTYESFSENPLVVSNLGASYIYGIQSMNMSATAKHFVADGGTYDGKDQGNAVLEEAEVRDIHLLPYYDAIEAEVDSIMISYSSINGSKMHGSEYWITDVLKQEMGFEGFIVSDWEAIHQLPGSFYDQIVTTINAGVDMLMEPDDWKAAYENIVTAYENNDISEERINDAVRRILTIKYNRGLFGEQETPSTDLMACQEHIDLAREAVRKSLVLLQNNNDSLPISKTEKIYITGPGADDIGLVLGGWSVGWQGLIDPNTDDLPYPGQYKKEARVTTIYEGFYNALTSYEGQLVSSIEEADTVIVVFAETVYAEYYGDNASLDLFTSNTSHPGNEEALQDAIYAQTLGKNTVGILLSGRPMLLGDNLDYFDSFVAAWLPGSEAGNGIADVLLGDYNFVGTTQFVWHKDASTYGTNSNSVSYKEEDYLFPYGFGLTYNE